MSAATSKPKKKSVRLNANDLAQIAEARRKPEHKYFDVPTFCRIYGMSHGKAFAFITDHPELTISLPNIGKKRGKRLFIVERLNAFFDELIAEQDAQKKVER